MQGAEERTISCCRTHTGVIAEPYEGVEGTKDGTADRSGVCVADDFPFFLSLEPMMLSHPRNGESALIPPIKPSAI
jgi:hypothetical protein